MQVHIYGTYILFALKLIMDNPKLVFKITEPIGILKILKFIVSSPFHKYGPIIVAKLKILQLEI